MAIVSLIVSAVYKECTLIITEGSNCLSVSQVTDPSTVSTVHKASGHGKNESSMCLGWIKLREAKSAMSLIHVQSVPLTKRVPTHKMQAQCLRRITLHEGKPARSLIPSVTSLPQRLQSRRTGCEL